MGRAKGRQKSVLHFQGVKLMIVLQCLNIYFMCFHLLAQNWNRPITGVLTEWA